MGNTRRSMSLASFASWVWLGAVSTAHADGPHIPSPIPFDLDRFTPEQTAVIRAANETDPTPYLMRTRPVVSQIVLTGNDADETRTTGPIESPAEVLVYALGEAAGGAHGETLVDYAWIEDFHTGERVWEMTAENAVHAGGDPRTRKAVQRLTLEPGRYRLRYVSNGSHAYPDWVGEPPERERMYGVTMFNLGAHAGLEARLEAAGVPSLRASLERPDLGAAVAAAVEPYVEARDFAGVIAVGRQGYVTFVEGYGFADVEAGRAHAPDGVFMVGSVSKQFTAAAVLLLEEEGALSTDDPVSRHLPDFLHGENITIDQLVHHTAGVADVYSLPLFGASEGREGTFEEVVAELGALPLTHEPGSRSSYSNGGYSLLAAIIERASGTTYGEFLSERIFEPLGMVDTLHDDGKDPTGRRVGGYDPRGARDLEPARPPAPAFTMGSGSLWSSARDLVRWTHALHAGEVLSEGSYAKFVEGDYGYGVSVFERLGRRVVGHDGRVTGYASDLAHYLDEEMTVVVLGNVQSVARDEIRTAVAAAALGEPVVAAKMRTFAAAAPRPLGDYAGTYRFAPTLAVDVVARDGRLMAKANEGSFTEIIPVDSTYWFSRALYATIRFSFGEGGAADSMFWGDESRQWPGARVR